MTVVIGNGESRNYIDLNSLKSKTYGCNAIYRDFTPDYLISIDNKMIHEIVESGYADNNICYFEDFELLPFEVVQMLRSEFENNYEIRENKQTKHCFVRGQNKEIDNSLYLHDKPIMYLTWISDNHNCRNVPDHVPDMDSGQIATWLAAENEEDDIYLIGFDLYTNEGMINNIYKDTNCYANKNTTAVSIETKLSFFDKVFTHFTNKNFYWIHKNFTNLDLVKKYKNLHHLTYDELNKEL